MNLKKIGRQTLTLAFLAAAVLGIASRAGAESLVVYLGDENGNRATDNPFQIGLGLQMGSTPDAEDGEEFLGLGDLTLGYTLSEHFTIGASNIAFAQATTANSERYAISAGPYGELFTFFSEGVQPYAQLGVPLQLRFGGDLDEKVGVAPYAAAGMRFWATTFLTLGVETRVALVATDAWLAQGRVLPQLAVPWTAGANLGFHL